MKKKYYNVTNYNVTIPDLQEQDWYDIARNNQKIPKGDWTFWLVLAGRGFGKTRTGAESIVKLIQSGEYKNIAVVGHTIRDARSVMMEGMSGIMSTSYAKNGNINFFPSKNEAICTNGAKITILGGDNVDSFRGYQFDLIWSDEFAKCKKTEKIMDQIMMTLRLGKQPRCIITTTPRNLQVLKELLTSPFTFVTRGTTFENAVNLSPWFIQNIEFKYKDTSIGRQELYGEIVDDGGNNLWKPENIKYKEIDHKKDIKKVVIGVDPAVTCSKDSDETGIVVAGVGYDDKVYVLEDLSGKYRPPEWAKIVATACSKYQASRVVAEVNNGGDLVGEMIKTISRYIPFYPVHAIRGKTSRAEPIALMYESGQVYHHQKFEKLELQMKSLTHDDDDNSDHDDRVDALVWALTYIKDSALKHKNVSVDFI